MSSLSKKLYFDSSLFIPVFESATFFEDVQHAVGENRARIIASDIDLAEATSGTGRESFRHGIERLVSLGPIWTVLAGVPAREILYEKTTSSTTGHQTDRS
jgi:hypothetical protein